METFYLSANVGFSLLKDQSQVFHVVCLKEAFNLCLAGERAADENMQDWNPHGRVALGLEETPNITNNYHGDQLIG